MKRNRFRSISLECSTTKKRNAFSIIEVLLAVAFFTLVVTSLVGGVIYGRQSTAISGYRLRAVMLAEEGIEALRSIQAQNWASFEYNQSGIELSGDEWILSGEGTSESIDGVFTRFINFSEVCRDNSDIIVDCPGDYIDVNTKKAVVEVSWEIRSGVNYSVQLPIYLTNWNYSSWTQTDWSGGTGQTIWSDITRYLSGSNVNHSVSGELKLSGGGGGGVTEDWTPKYGKLFTDRSDTDFNQGSYTSNTQISGSGTTAKVVLTSASQWAEHANSGLITSAINGVSAVDTDNIWAVGSGNEFLRYNGSTWSIEADLGSNTLYDIDMLSTSLGWAVGASSKFYRYNGSWSEFQDLGNNQIYGIDMVNSSSGWAVGNSSKIYYYNGSNWSQFVDLGNNNINSVHMLSASSGWAAGSSGKIYRYNGLTWSEFADYGNQRWESIYMVSSSEGWVTASNGEVRRFNGSTWNVNITLTGAATDVFMVSASDGWISGSQGRIFHWNGSAWSEHSDIGNQNWECIVFPTANNGWIFGGSGEIYYYGNFYQSLGTYTSRVFDSGSATTAWDVIYWEEILPTGADITLQTRTGNTATPDGSWSGWSAAVTDSFGSSITSPDNTQYIQYMVNFTRGTSPTETPQLDYVGILYDSATNKNLNDVDIIATDNAWAVGDDGTFVHYNGTAWSLHTDLGINEEVYAVDHVSDTDIWACGNSGKIYHYDGATWSEHTDIGSTNLNDIDMIASDDGWISADGGEIYHWNGSNWSVHTDLGSMSFNAISMVSASEGWAAGTTGNVAYYNGSTWTIHTTVSGQTFYSIDMLSSSDGWMSGNNGKIYHYDGANWTEHSDTGGQLWHSISMGSADVGWVVGNGGEFYKYDTGTWSSYLQTGPDTWYGVDMLSEEEGWAVGTNGQIRHYKESGGGYQTSGYAISSAYDMGADSYVNSVDWDETIPVCTPVCEVKVQLRTAPDNSGTPGTWTDWYGPAGSGDYFTDYLGELAPKDLSPNQWIQYRVEFVGDGVDTPLLTEIRVNYQ